jgi:uncharacterized membrane protein YgcG
MIESAAEEAVELSRLLRGWLSTLSGARACAFSMEMVEPWHEEADSVRSLQDGLQLLHDWVHNSEGHALPGVRALKDRKAAFEDEYAEACRRRKAEGRPPPPNMGSTLDGEWAAMQNAAQVLRARAVPMMDWHEQQLKEHRASFEKLNRPLDTFFDRKDAHSVTSLRDSITLTLMKGAGGAHHANPEAAVINKWTKLMGDGEQGSASSSPEGDKGRGSGGGGGGGAGGSGGGGGAATRGGSPDHRHGTHREHHTPSNCSLS